MNKIQKKVNKKNASQGFSLVEFIVILTLFGIMASVVTFDYQEYRSKIERSNFATDIALAFRQMQVYGISSSNRNIGGVGFDTADGTADVQDIVSQDLVLDVGVYGVQIDLGTQALTLYQEVGGDEKAFDSGTDVAVDVLQINGDNRILRICVTDSEQQADINEVTGACESSLSNPSQEISTGKFTVSFKRPFPDSRFLATALDPAFDVTTGVLVVGPQNAPGKELRYVFFDPIGLIQVIQPNFVN